MYALWQLPDLPHPGLTHVQKWHWLDFKTTTKKIKKKSISSSKQERTGLILSQLIYLRVANQLY